MLQQFSNHETPGRSRLYKAVPLVLMLAIFGSQLLAVQHDHDGDLSHHADCSVCVKQNSESDFLLPSNIVPSIELLVDATSSRDLAKVSRIPVVANARAPPSV